MKPDICKHSILFSLFFLVLAGCTSESPDAPAPTNMAASPPATQIPEEPELIIRGGILLDMVSDSPTPIPVKGIVIRDGVIAQIIPVDSSTDLPQGQVVIDAGSGYILPGLIDSHVHFRTWTPEASLWRRGNLYYGVTTIFDTGPCSRGCVETGRDPDEWIAAYKQFMHDSTGPTLYFTGRRLDGPVSGHPLSLVAETPDEIIQYIDHLVDLGVDGIKVESTLSSALRKVAVDTARQRGLPVVGHSKDARESISAGMKFIEHMWPVTSSISLSDPGEPFNSPTHDHLMDLDKAHEIIDLMLDEQVYLNPTMMGRYAHLSERAESYAEEDELLMTFGHIYSDFPEHLKADTPAWMRRAERLDQETRNQQQQGLEKVQSFLKQFSEAGGKILAATDVNPPRLPGITMHRELQMLVDAGVPPYRALLGATRWPSEMMNKSNLIGTVEEGKQADIIILGTNPVDAISNSRDVEYVIRRGVLRRTPDYCSVILPPISMTCR